MWCGAGSHAGGMHCGSGYHQVTGGVVVIRFSGIDQVTCGAVIVIMRQHLVQ